MVSMVRIAGVLQIQEQKPPGSLTPIPPMSGFESILAVASSRAVPLTLEKSEIVFPQSKPSPGAEHVFPMPYKYRCLGRGEEEFRSTELDEYFEREQR